MNAIASPPQLICPHGHGPATPGSHFCNWCGSALLPAPQAPPTGYANNYPPPPPVYAPPPPVCGACAGGTRLDPLLEMCPQCRWLRPLAPDYRPDCSVFQWAQDGTAMATLRSMTTLTTIAKSVSDKVGRPWIETTCNGVRLSSKQMPALWAKAVLAARLVGLTRMPDVYVSGDRMWDNMTFGSDTTAFVVIGTAVATNFHDDELLFLLAREMGHCRAGHALWKTVIRFLTGDIGPKRGLMSDGLMGAISPTKLVESAIEMPLMAWARQSEVTADRAGLLAVGDESLVRRVLLAWTLRSAVLFRQINIEAWMEQEEDSENQLTRVSEMTSSSTLFITRRLRLLSHFAQEPELMRWAGIARSLRPVTRPPANAAAAPPKTQAEGLALACPNCRVALRVPFNLLRGKDSLNVRCPQCRGIVPLRKKTKAATSAAHAK